MSEDLRQFLLGVALVLCSALLAWLTARQAHFTFWMAWLAFVSGSLLASGLSHAWKGLDNNRYW